MVAPKHQEVPEDLITHIVEEPAPNTAVVAEGEVPEGLIVQGSGVGGDEFVPESRLKGAIVGGGLIGLPAAKLIGEGMAAKTAYDFAKERLGKTPEAAPAPQAETRNPAEKWNRAMHGTDIPNAQMDKESFDIGQRMQKTVGPGGELQGGSIRGGIMIGPEAERQIAMEEAKRMQAERDAETYRHANRTARQKMAEGWNIQKEKLGVTEGAGKKLLNKAVNAGMAVPAAAGAGFNAVDTYNRLKQGDYGQAAVGGAGTIGSLLTMVPNKKVRAVGAALGAGAPVVNAGIDVVKGRAEGGYVPPHIEHMRKGGSVQHFKNGKAVAAEEILDWYKRANTGVKSNARLAREAAYTHDIVPSHLFGTPKHVGIQDLQKEKAVIVPVAGDRTMTGHKLRSVNNVPLRNEVELEGGPLYGQKENEQGRSGFWAANNGTAQGFQNMLMRGIDRYGDRPMYGLYGAMDYDAGNFAKHNTRALYEQIDAMNPSKAQVNAFDKHMRARHPNWVGVKDEDALNQLLGSVPMRKFFAETLNKPTKAAEFGMPSGEATIHAITEPGLRDVPVGNMGFSVGRLDPKAPITLDPTHNETYNRRIPGEAVGQMKAQLHWSDYFPDAHKQIMSNPRQANSAWGTFKMGDYYQPVTQELVDRIAPIEEAIAKHSDIILPGQPGWFKKGGSTNMEYKPKLGGQMHPWATNQKLTDRNRTAINNMDRKIRTWEGMPASEKMAAMGNAGLDAAELAASFHPGYGLGYAGAALADAAMGNRGVGGAMVDAAFNAPGVMGPVGKVLNKVAPYAKTMGKVGINEGARYAIPTAGLGALAVPHAAGAGADAGYRVSAPEGLGDIDEGSYRPDFADELNYYRTGNPLPKFGGGGSVFKKIFADVVEGMGPKAAREIEAGAPHTYGPQATGQWMRDYQQAAPAVQPQVPGEYFDRHVWDQIAEKHRNAQNATDYMMGRTGPNPRQQIQYMGKYRQGTPEERAMIKAQEQDAMRAVIDARKNQWMMRSREMGMTDQEIADEIAHSMTPPWMP